jgi:PAS domain S-box-containing protein
MIPRRGRMKLAHRFTLVFALVVCSITGVVAGLTEFYLRRTLMEASEQRVRSLGQSLSAVARSPLLNYDYIALQQMADAMLDEPDVAYAVILDKEGRVAGYSGAGNRQRTRSSDLQTRDDPESKARVARTDWIGPDGKAVPVYEAVVPVALESGARWGTVKLGLSLGGVLRKIWWTRILLAGLAFAGAFAAALAAHLLARRITRPLGRLVAATLELERGEWDPEFSLDTGDEIGDLAQSFSTMAASLDRQTRALVSAKEELTALNATLEEKVEQRTAELRASRGKYRLLVQGSPDAFVLLQGERVLFANAAFGQIFEHPSSALEEEVFTWRRVIHPNFHALAEEQLRRVTESAEAFGAEWIGVTRKGRTVDLEVRGRGVDYEGARVIELVLSDVTERRRLLRQIVQNERLRAMGEMTAMVAHHFNNILAVIQGRSQLLQLRVADQRARESLEIIQSSVGKAGEMVRHLQDYYGEQVDLRFTEIDVNDLLSEVAGYQESLWRTTRAANLPPVTIDLDLRPVPRIRGADPLLQDAFRRILINAAEAMLDGGVIHVTTESTETELTIRIEDSGCGMEPEVLNHACDPFFTTKGPRTRGLGLSASVGILQRHEGKLRIESRPGTGTTVLVILPVRSRGSTILPLNARGAAGAEGEKLA